jgi:hypothetical protein
MLEATARAEDVFFNVDSGPKPRVVSSIDPRATQYGFVPIWPVHGLPSSAFKLHSLPGNKFVPFRVFQIPTANASGETHDAEGKPLTRDRMPNEQVADLYNVAGEEKHATHFPELALLENETEAREIITVLANPNQCDKWGDKLGTSCATCWLDYLRTEASGEIAGQFGQSPRLMDAAVATAQRLIATFEAALATAKSNVDVALREIDDPKTGKDRFYSVDYLNVWHTHQSEPQFRTTTAREASFDGLAKALEAAITTKQGGLTSEDVQSMIDRSVSSKTEALEQENAALRAKLDALNAPVDTRSDIAQLSAATGKAKREKGNE